MTAEFIPPSGSDDPSAQLKVGDATNPFTKELTIPAGQLPNQTENGLAANPASHIEGGQLTVPPINMVLAEKDTAGRDFVERLNAGEVGVTTDKNGFLVPPRSPDAPAGQVRSDGPISPKERAEHDKEFGFDGDPNSPWAKAQDEKMHREQEGTLPPDPSR